MTGQAATTTTATADRNERVLGPLKVGLRRDLHFTRQATRGGPRYIAHDPVTFENHAFGAADYQVITAITHERTLSATFEQLVMRGLVEDTADGRDGFYRFVIWLHGKGLVHLPIGNGDLLWDRHNERREQHRTAWYRTLMYHKVPLGSPDAFLRRTMPLFGWLFSVPGLLLWTALMGLVAWKCFGRFDELFGQARGLLTIANLPLLWGALVVLKALHEFGHAYACRRFGAAVPEMGVVLIMLTPCAYVDASASWRLDSRRRRAIVALGGMYVESIIAALAALVWLGTPPGFVHDLALNVVVLASVVTVLFNINPLMKYDGYYLFSDVVGVFNLQQRSAEFLNAWVAHLVLGSPRPQHDYAPSERWLYATFGPATVVYRMFLAFAITALVMAQWPGAGLFLAAVFFYGLAIQPTLRLLLRLWRNDAPAQRVRSRLVAVSLVTILPMLASMVPISWHVTAPGILDPQSRETVRAPAAGFVVELDHAIGDAVSKHDRLGRLENPDLEARHRKMRNELLAERTSLDAIELEDPTQAAIHRSRIDFLEAGVTELKSQLDAMTLTAATTGRIANPERHDWRGRFVQQGEELLQVHSEHRFLRVVLTDEAVSRTRLEVGSQAIVRFTCDPTRAIQATVRDIKKSASRERIPLALTMLAGGDVYARPLAEGSAYAVADEPYLHILLEVEDVPLVDRGAGLTARVQFDARIELFGAWLHRRVVGFFNSWRMS